MIEHKTKPITKCLEEQQAGGAALEYVIVSTLAAAISVAAVAVIGKVVEEKLQDLSKKLGIPFEGLPGSLDE